ncbi:cytochrome-c peroxidase [Rhizobium sullae]|uniref:Cytochrome c peroxidase n=1 Tax=Rhizobium sullae TaxID=50338 RepID=A0A4R3PZV9_RHISU|nr:cytochrome c peroxidase [Rhizobium sullae]TCU13477.1 cytochrome c peroxidase [Rhizobium sullae]
MTHGHIGKDWAGLFVPLCLAMAAPALALMKQPAPLPEEPIAPLAAAGPSDQAKIALGEGLFNDARLSHDGVFACSSCHRLELSGDDGQARSVAADGESLDFNAPTVFNSAFSFRLNWRGNFDTLEEQNEAVLLDDKLMNTSWDELLPKLRSDRNYAERFARIYGEAASRATVLDALAVFQRSLITPDARFDRYLKGERDAITADEEHGYQLFKAYGCVACHQGANVGGNLFQKFGIFQDPFAGQKALSEADQGRFAITRAEADRHVFRVPSLRNVAVTSPYFHDGRTGSLGEAVKIMARNQLGRELDQRDSDLIVKFLGTLTGEYRGRPLTSAAERLEQ